MLVAIILATILVVYLVDSFYWRRRKLPPGPMPLPLIGNMVSLMAAADPVDQFLKWRKQYGPVYTVWLGPFANVFVTDYDVMHDAFVKQGDAYAGRMRNYAVDQVRGGNKGLIFSDGNLWLEQRRFALHVLRDFGVGRSIMEDNILTESRALVDGIREKLHKSGESTEVEVTPLLTVCIGSIINALVFGYRFENDKLEEFVHLKKLLDQGVSPEFQFLFFIAGPISTKLPFIRSSWNRFKSCMGGIYDFIDKNLAAHRTTFDPNEEPTDFAYAFLNKIHQLKQQGKSIENYSNRQFTNVAFDLWGAGLETTLTTLRWSILYMIHHPEVQEKIHQELDRVIGRDRDVIMADKPTLPYTMATINEVQRRANLFPFNVPHTTTQEVTLAGFQIPKDTIIQPLISCVHRDEQYFPSPDLFQPERFLNSDGSLKKVEQLVPFSLGKRQCMGESLARMELFLLFANFMHNFNVSAPTGKPLPTLKPKIEVIFATLLVVYLVDTFYWKRRKLPPGPTPLPLIGNMIPFIAAADPIGQFLKWKKQYGPVYTVWLGPYANVFVTDYDVMHDALVKQGDAYAGRMRNYAVDQVRGGNRGIIFSEGNLWLEQRRFALH
uniref:Uncharacterized protein n=1 Tax=Plectus sambesii TaxID=2011161 RepID=A0A914UYU2_9BILA